REFSERYVDVAHSSPDSLTELSYAYNSLGSIALQQDDPESAAKAFSQSMSLKKRALAVQPDKANLKVDYANSMLGLATAYVRLGQLKEAYQLYGKQVETLNSLVQNAPTNRKWAQRLGLAYWNQADLEYALGMYPKSMASFQRAEDLLTSNSTQDPTNVS